MAQSVPLLSPLSCNVKESDNTFVDWPFYHSSWAQHTMQAQDFYLDLHQIAHNHGNLSPKYSLSFRSRSIYYYLRGNWKTPISQSQIALWFRDQPWQFQMSEIFSYKLHKYLTGVATWLISNISSKTSLPPDGCWLQEIKQGRTQAKNFLVNFDFSLVILWHYSIIITKMYSSPLSIALILCHIIIINIKICFIWFLPCFHCTCIYHLLQFFHYFSW